jgi:hypothetical protein
MSDWKTLLICMAVAVLMMAISYYVSDMDGMKGQAVREREAARARALSSIPAGTTVPASEIPSLLESTVPASEIPPFPKTTIPGATAPPGPN